MADNLVQARVEAIRRLARRQATRPLIKALIKSSPQDIAEAITHLTRSDTSFVVVHIPDEQAGEVLLMLNEDDFALALAKVPATRVELWLEELDPDDQADLMARLPDKLREQLLARMEPAEREQAEELMAWPEDSAGGIMSPVAFLVHTETTCRDAIASLQEQGDVEMVFYLYVENDNGQLVGVTSLRQLLLKPPSTEIQEFMTPEVISVHPETDQEEVARIAARYDFLAVPVVDDTNGFLGIVTIDDVLDVLREEAAEDMLKMAGVAEEFDLSGTNTWRAARQRLTWLVVTLLGGILLSEVIGGFRATLEEQVVLAGFYPVIMALGGGVGIQAATIAVRNLATGGVRIGEGGFTLVFRELRVSLILGVVLGSALAGFGILRYGEPTLGGVIGGSIVATVFAAAAFGTIIPLLMDKANIDPALATGPFVTILIDAVAIVVYMTLATALYL
ncbi:MAG: magnesium transporter [Proteobacteria bacterium]|nr:magnesium transporter [Pseudomonadota bacterium]MCP4921889.1 magnesium transporter [Pseudomonadota bacterium]